jgi:hypothetical protein
MRFRFPEILLLAGSFLFAAGAHFLGNRILNRLTGINQPDGRFRSVIQLTREFSDYRRVAPLRGWPTWPVPVFWSMALISIAFGIAWVVWQ